MYLTWAEWFLVQLQLLLRVAIGASMLPLSACAGWEFPDCDLYGPLDYVDEQVQGAEIICYFERDI